MTRWSIARVSLLLAALAACGDTYYLLGSTSADLDGCEHDDAGADAEVDASGDAVADAAPDAPHYDINHVLGTGQSMAMGYGGTPWLTDASAFNNLMFNGGVMPSFGEDGGWDASLAALVPLLEGDLVYSSTTMRAETMSSGFANWVSESEPGHNLLISIHGAGGTTYSALRRSTLADGGFVGTPNYAAGIEQVRRAKAIADAESKSYVVRAVTVVHGEADSNANNQNYGANVATWQTDYENDVKAITGQAEPVILFHTQTSSWQLSGVNATSTIPTQQLAASIASGGKVVMVGPKYMLDFLSNNGGHPTNVAYQRMGEYYAKAYRRVILEGGTWEPLRPISVSRTSNVITVRFIAPVLPLAIDTTRVALRTNYGFEYSGPETITSVALSGSDTVAVTLSAEPTTAGRIRYAYTANLPSISGRLTGPRGNLRDSDTTPSRYGYSLHNWCVHFDEAVP